MGHVGKVITVVKIYPDEGFSAEQVMGEVRKIKECNSARVEEIAFGAKAVIASFVCEDAEAKDFEEIARGVRGVSEVQVEEVGLV